MGLESRKPTLPELNLIHFLVSKTSPVRLSPNWKETLRVRILEDGGMGSLALFQDGKIEGEREFGKVNSECQFADEDGVVIIASLYLDKDDKPFELDLWKVDFSPLIKIPEAFQSAEGY